MPEHGGIVEGIATLATTAPAPGLSLSITATHNGQRRLYRQQFRIGGSRHRGAAGLHDYAERAVERLAGFRAAPSAIRAP